MPAFLFALGELVVEDSRSVKTHLTLKLIAFGWLVLVFRVLIFATMNFKMYVLLFVA